MPDNDRFREIGDVALTELLAALADQHALETADIATIEATLRKIAGR